MKMPFGKYKDKNLLDIAKDDPDYIFWLIENEVIQVPDEIYDVAFDTLEDTDEDNYGLYDWGEFPY